MIAFLWPLASRSHGPTADASQPATDQSRPEAPMTPGCHSRDPQTLRLDTLGGLRAAQDRITEKPPAFFTDTDSAKLAWSATECLLLLTAVSNIFVATDSARSCRAGNFFRFSFLAPDRTTQPQSMRGDFARGQWRGSESPRILHIYCISRGVGALVSLRVWGVESVSSGVTRFARDALHSKR
ncbi:MAG: hypothetical protein L0241_27785 [Planctomycetia bacterium]|nr:hypothetical protein [Planctomycetia bacterium]